MLEYLPELMKGLHTSLTLTVASIIVALILAYLHHHPDAENAGAGVDCARLHHPVYRYAAAGADLPDLLRARAVPVIAELPGYLAPAL
jgi:ABC-type amino acid transport system permease subunit